MLLLTFLFRPHIRLLSRQRNRLLGSEESVTNNFIIRMNDKALNRIGHSILKALFLNL
jgi:hypothetical protein